MAVVSTGFFDGVHLGHRKILTTLVNSARERDDKSLVITFWPHPRIVLQNDASILRLLSTQEEKMQIMKSIGVDDVKVLEFTSGFAALTTREYIGMLISDFEASTLVLGYDNRIGSDMLPVQETARIARELGLEVIVVEAEHRDSVPTSSSGIRRLLAEGQVKSAAGLLGDSYRITGAVVSGKRLGRTIGYPTANTQLREPLKMLPSRGAYVTKVEVKGKEYFGMTNVGDIVETHIFDFSEDIYGLDIRISFLDRLRDPLRFSSVEELKNQLQIDEISAKKLIFEVQ